jgi:FkbM family methyltransferase|tara:strand:- start:92 stop:877 length:786 start_codon:yes stop_codon:yes gene_type:complete
LEKGFFEKLNILIQSTRIIKNWYILPLVYFNLINKPTVQIKLKNGINIILRVDKKSSDLDILIEIFVEKAYFHEGFEIQNEDIIIDVGGHIGIFSMYAAQFCKAGKIFCFEPLPDNFQILKSNVMKNNLENIFIENSAISNKNHNLKFYQSNDDFAGGSLLKKSNNFFEVKCNTLEQIFENNTIKKCNILKMDCEGAEYEILLNLPKKIISKIDKIYLEYHDINSSDYSVKSIIDILEINDFQVLKVPVEEGLGYIYAKHK